jgi:GNAT superfamily N-acetyltransferase
VRVAQDDGAIIALLVLEGDWVDQLYVEPTWTAKGVGTRLIGLAKERRASRLTLWTFQTNSGARRFYERHGFVAMETTEGHNEEGFPAIRYEWRAADSAPPVP